MINEHNLINQCKKGIRDAQKTLYDNYKSKWFMICLRYVKKREDALDVLQNALVKIYSKLDTFDDTKGNFDAWSSRIVVNESIMFQRKFWRQEEVSELNLDYHLTHQDASAISNLTVQELTKMIQKLPDGYRLVFNMYTIEGFSHKEIAEELGITIGTSKSQLFKAKNMLRERLESAFYKEDRFIS